MAQEIKIHMDSLDDKHVKSHVYDDSTLWCEECETTVLQKCPKHGQFLPVRDKQVLSRARLTAPHTIRIRRMGPPCRPDSVIGAFAKKVIQRRTQFGPVEGKCITTTPGRTSCNLPLKIFTEGSRPSTIDCSDETRSNWMMFVRPADSKEEQNLVAFQHSKQIYFIATKHIPIGTELKVLYSRPYGEWMQESLLDECPDGNGVRQEPSDSDQWEPLLSSSLDVGSPEAGNVSLYENSAKLNGNTLKDNEHHPITINLNEHLERDPTGAMIVKTEKCPSFQGVSVSDGTHMSREESDSLAGEQTSFVKPGMPDSDRSPTAKRRHIKENTVDLEENETLAEQEPQKNTGDGFDRHETKVSKRKRGRPPKVTTSLESTKDSANGISSGHPRPEVAAHLIVPKTRGRPRKIRSPTAKNIKVKNDDTSATRTRDIRSAAKQVRKLRRKRAQPLKFEHLAMNQETSSENGDISCSATSELSRKRPKKKHSMKGRGQLYVCQNCDKAFSTRTKLRVHGYIHSGERPFKCHCGTAFITKYQLDRHNLIHTSDRKFVCTYMYCEKTFARKDHLQNHLRVHDPNKTEYLCGECDKSYGTKYFYDVHRTAHALARGELRCLVCQTEFDNHPQLSFHLKKHKGSRKVKTDADKKQLCTTCGKKFYTKKDLKRHAVVHTKERDFLCEFCSRTFGRRDHLARHMNKHHSLAPGNSDVPHIPDSETRADSKKNVSAPDTENNPVGSQAVLAWTSQDTVLKTQTETEAPQGEPTHAALHGNQSLVPVYPVEHAHSISILTPTDNRAQSSLSARTVQHMYASSLHQSLADRQTHKTPEYLHPGNLTVARDIQSYAAGSFTTATNTPSGTIRHFPTNDGVGVVELQSDIPVFGTRHSMHVSLASDRARVAQEMSANTCLEGHHADPYKTSQTWSGTSNVFS